VDVVKPHRSIRAVCRPNQCSELRLSPGSDNAVVKLGKAGLFGH
jgi:hypothetical protein